MFIVCDNEAVGIVCCVQRRTCLIIYTNVYASRADQLHTQPGLKLLTETSDRIDLHPVLAPLFPQRYLDVEGP